MPGTSLIGRPCAAPLRVLIDGLDLIQKRALARGLLEALTALRISARCEDGPTLSRAPRPEVLVQLSSAEHALAMAEARGHRGASLALRAWLPVAPRFHLTIYLSARPETARRRALDRKRPGELDGLLYPDGARFRAVDARLRALLTRRGATVIETDALSGSELLAATLAAVLTRLGLAAGDHQPRGAARDRGRPGGGLGLPDARREPALARARRVHGARRV